MAPEVAKRVQAKLRPPRLRSSRFRYCQIVPFVLVSHGPFPVNTVDRLRGVLRACRLQLIALRVEEVSR